MKVIKSTVFGLAVSLSGCVTMEQLQTGLDRLYGKPQSTVVAALGYPDNVAEVGDDTVYLYGRNDSSVMFLTNYNYGSNTYSQTAVPVNYNCNIKVILNSGFVKHWEARGNESGCKPYIEKLNAYFN